MASASVKASTSMKASSARETASVEPAKAGLSPEGVGSRHAPMVKSAECARTSASHFARAGGSGKPLTAGRSAAAFMVEVHSTGLETVAVDDRSAMGDICVVVIDNPAVMAPVESPMAPPPAKAAKESNSEAKAKSDPGPFQEKPRIGIPTWEHRQRIAVHEPRIILGNVNDVGLRGLN
jgi:hypothetical protein